MQRTVIECKAERALLLEDFLPLEVWKVFREDILARRAKFRNIDWPLPDPEYTAVQVLSDVGLFKDLFRDALQAAWRDIFLTLRMEMLQPREWNAQVFSFQKGAYRKPRAEALHADQPVRLVALYCVSTNSEASEHLAIRIFDYNPYLTQEAQVHTTVEFNLLENALLVLSSETFYAVSMPSRAFVRSDDPILLLELGVV